MIVTIKTFFWCLLWIVLSQVALGTPSLLRAPPGDNNKVENRIDLLADFFRQGLREQPPEGLSYTPAEPPRELQQPTERTKVRLPAAAQVAAVADGIMHIPGEIADMISTTPRLKVRLPQPEDAQPFVMPRLPTFKPLEAPTLAERLKMLPELYQTEEPTSVEKMARAHRAFDRMVQFINIVGQVDAFISDQAKLAVRKLAAMYNEEERFARGY